MPCPSTVKEKQILIRPMTEENRPTSPPACLVLNIFTADCIGTHKPIVKKPRLLLRKAQKPAMSHISFHCNLL